MSSSNSASTAIAVQKKATKLADKAIKIDEKTGKPVIDWSHVDSGIEYQGTKITLPDDPDKMPLEEAIAALKRKQADENQMMDVHETIDAFPLDAAVAFTLALKEKYGWASPVPVPGFFGPEPPQMLTVEIGPEPGDQVQVPWGGFRIPGIENIVQTHVTSGEFGPVFVISSQLRKRESFLLKDIANLTRQIVRERSIYRGKAIRLRTDSNGKLNWSLPPKFIQTKHIKPDELILSADVLAAVETNVFTLIRHTENCQRVGIPLKRGVLLEGPYGTGKTLIAGVCAKHAVDHGWTYITLDKCQGLEEALHFARRYEPAVIFAEDIDRVTEERDEDANDLLNILDGVLSKNSQVLVVLTTNHVEKINQAMLRPGRLDAVISVSPPDAGAVAKLLMLYGRGQFASNITLARVSGELSGSTPAVIREVVERSKLAMVGRDASELVEDDLLVSVSVMKNHMRLLEAPKSTEPTPEEALGQAFANLLKARGAGGAGFNEDDREALCDTQDQAMDARNFAKEGRDLAASGGAAAKSAATYGAEATSALRVVAPKVAKIEEGVQALRAKAKV